MFGNLIKWKEGDRIGSGASGEVFIAMNTKTFSQFAVKKLTLVSPTFGVDKESINKLKVIFLEN